MKRSTSTRHDSFAIATFGETRANAFVRAGVPCACKRNRTPLHLLKCSVNSTLHRATLRSEGITIFEKQLTHMTDQEKISKQMSRFLTGFSLSKAILEDYSKVIAKLEGVTEQEVKDRINKRSAELFEEAKKDTQP